MWTFMKSLLGKNKKKTNKGKKLKAEKAKMHWMNIFGQQNKFQVYLVVYLLKQS